MPKNFEPNSTNPLDSIDGEPLQSSGFEDEQPEDGFDDGGDDGNQ
jgi:hypothetical protein